MGKSNKAIIYLLSTIAIILWGMSYIWINQLIAKGISVFYFVFLRIVLAGTLMILFNLGARYSMRIEKRDLPIFLLLGFFEPFLYFMTESYGIQLSGSPTLGAIIIATTPIFSLIVGVMFCKEKTSWVNILGILLSFCGICLAVLSKEEFGPNLIWGILLLFGAVISEVGQATVTKRLATKYRSTVIVMYKFTIGAIYFLPIFLVFGLRNFQPGWLSWDAWKPIICLAVLCSSLALTIWVGTIRNLGIAKAGVFLAIIPVVEALVAWLLGEEYLSIRQWAGIAISTAGVVLSQCTIGRKCS